MIHLKSTDAKEITLAFTYFISEKRLDCLKLVGQSCDCAATFSGSRSGVQRSIRVHAASSSIAPATDCSLLLCKQPSLLLHCLPHWPAFGNCEIVQLFFPKSRSSEDIQSVLSLLELNLVNPSLTWWFSHERCVWAICKEFPALVTLHRLYEDCDDAGYHQCLILLSSIASTKRGNWFQLVANQPWEQPFRTEMPQAWGCRVVFSDGNHCWHAW